MQTTTPELQWLTIVQASRYLNLSVSDFQFINKPLC
jgi:hypothetical protein